MAGMRSILFAALLAIAAAPCGAQQEGSMGKAPQRKVLAELYTAIWCGPCVKNALIVEGLRREFGGRVITVSIHSSARLERLEKMAFDVGDTIATIFGVPPVPRHLYDRTSQEIARRLEAPAVADVQIEHSYDAATRTVNATLTATFADQSDTGDIRFNFYVVEDSVVGEGWGYDQLSSEEHEPSSPYYRMGNAIAGYAHRNVLRAVPSGAYGTGGVIPSVPAIGVTYRQSYTWTIPESHNPLRTHLVGFLSHAPIASSGRADVLNVAEAPLIAQVSSAPIATATSFELSIAPMPLRAGGSIDLRLVASAEVSIELSDMMGREVATILHGMMESGDHRLPLEVGDFREGAYILVAKVDGKVMARRKMIIVR